MKPLTHAKNSVRKFGGKIDDYIPLHEWMDHTKMLVPDMRYRMILQEALDEFCVETVMGA